MSEAYREIDAQYQKDMAEDDRIESIIESAIDDLNSALNSVTDRNRSFCVQEAIKKLKGLEPK